MKILLYHSISYVALPSPHPSIQYPYSSPHKEFAFGCLSQTCLCDFRVYGIRNSCQQTNKHYSHDFNKSKQNTFSTFPQVSVCQTPASQAQGLNSPSFQPVGYLCEIRTCTLFVIVLIAENSALLSSERRVGHFTFPSRHFTSPL